MRASIGLHEKNAYVQEGMILMFSSTGCSVEWMSPDRLISFLNKQFQEHQRLKTSWLPAKVKDMTYLVQPKFTSSWLS